jgi:hypothetical protein
MPRIYGRDKVNIQYILNKETLLVTTKGAEDYGLYNLRVAAPSESLFPLVQALLTYIFDYQINCKAKILPDQTMTLDYWLIKFIETDGFLDLWEYDESGTEFVPGINLTLRYWINQTEMCRRVQAEYTPTNAGKYVVVTDGVFEGKFPVIGMRVPSPDHMTGWWFCTDEKRVDEYSLDEWKVHHAYHLTSSRPELAAFMALPAGYRIHVTSTDQYHVEFDPDLLETAK